MALARALGLFFFCMISIIIIIASIAFFYLSRVGFYSLWYFCLALDCSLLFCRFLSFYRFFIFAFVYVLLWLFYPFTLPRGLSLFFGVPGSGKTTLCAYLAKRYKGSVFSNVPIIGTLEISRDDIGKYDISNGMLLIDEAGIDFNNRFGNRKGSSMALNEDATKWLKLYRHYKIDRFACFSQRVDIDITIRGLADRVYLLRKAHFPYVVIFQGVKKVLTVDTPPNSSCGQIVDAFRINSLDLHFVFTPPLWKLFNTYDAPALPAKQFAPWGSSSSLERERSEQDSASVAS